MHTLFLSVAQALDKVFVDEGFFVLIDVCFAHGTYIMQLTQCIQNLCLCVSMYTKLRASWKQAFS